MCGIAGRVGKAADPSVGSMVEALTHRGPDSRGLRAFPGCEIGMRRLRIVDLRPEGDQPMSGEDDQIWLVYNGELYNHVELRRELEQAGHTFRSLTDTEVIVHGYEEWSDDVVLRLRGMFAFGLWDGPQHRLVLARDRLGIKPLYLREEPNGGLAFASEAHALGPGKVDPRAIASYLRLGWVGNPSTVTVGVRELPPGHLLVHVDGRQEQKAYWRPIWRDEPVDRDRLTAALNDSVRRHLLADVPVGLFLSSGLDSTVLAALGARHVADLRTYTVAFDTEQNEVAPAAELARRLGIQHQVVPLSGGWIATCMPQVIMSMDQPTVDGVNSWAISRAVADAGLTVALSGLGGDELFAGYSTFRRVPQMVTMGTRAPRAALALANRMTGHSHRLELSRTARAGESILRGGAPAAYAGMRGLFSWRSIAALWPGGGNLLSVFRDEDLLATRPGQGDTVAALEVNNYLRHQLLRDTDVMSMAHSLEIRVPLLDDEVVAAALATRPTPDGLSGKALLAAAAGPVVTEAAHRRKLTFSLPFDQWLRHDLQPWAAASLRSLGASPLGFDPSAIARVESAFQSGRVHWRPIWGLAVLGAWLEAHAA